MARLTELADVMFPVAQQPVFARVAGATGERWLHVPGKKAIVNCNTDRVLGVVGRAYRLVTNQEALDLASRCCRTVFPETKDGEWQVRVADAPGTGGHCYMDLIHNSAELDFCGVTARDRPEVYGPFIRVTNSYNGLRALAFDIGFFRKVCANGLILPESVVRFRFAHARQDLGAEVKFEIAADRLAQMKESLASYLSGLRECDVPRPIFKTFVHGVLQIRSPLGQLEEPQPADWTALDTHVEHLCDRYAQELGENAYAIFNAVTEFASRPPKSRYVHRERHALQRLAGAWVTDFSQRCRKVGFVLTEYLQELAKPKVDEANLTQGPGSGQAAGRASRLARRFMSPLPASS